MKNEKDIINVEDENSKGGFKSKFKSGMKKISNACSKACNNLSDAVDNLSDKIKENNDINNAFLDKVTTLNITGVTNFLGNEKQIDAVIDETTKTLYFKKDEDLRDVFSGTILKSDNKNYEIDTIDKEKQVYYYVEVSEVSFEVPCFKATYK